MDKFFRDFEYFWNLINIGTNFTFARYADGEVMLMRGVGVFENTQAYSVDNWKAPNNLTKVGRELLETLNHTEENYYYAISGRNDNISDHNFLRENIKHGENNLTFVNLWINANYRNMVKKLAKLKRDTILICNEKAKIENFPFNVTSISTFPNDCITFWENNSESYMNDLIKNYGHMNNQLFLISCGPVSEIIIHRLYQNNPNNTYIDVGSSIDEFVHGKQTRPYMNPASEYSKFISSF